MTAPLYRDPIFDGPTDPVVIRNRATGEWWMFYTARRATSAGPGFAWVHGTDIGIATSRDGGGTWLYRGTVRGLDIEWGRNTFWAPEIVWAEGRYHMFVSYITGVPERWEGHDRRILHHVSDDLVDWTCRGPVELGSSRVIDAAIHQLPSGGYRMWFKDEEHGSHTYCADTHDPELHAWGPAWPALTGFEHEGPNVFTLAGRHWLIVDEWRGLSVYGSEDLESWKRQGMILDQPGQHPDDRDYGRHADVAVSGDERAYIFYFTHPGEASDASPASHERHRSLIHAAELTVENDRLVCHRDRELHAPFLPAD